MKNLFKFSLCRENKRGGRDENQTFHFYRPFYFCLLKLLILFFTQIVDSVRDVLE